MTPTELNKLTDRLKDEVEVWIGVEFAIIAVSVHERLSPKGFHMILDYIKELKKGQS